MAILKLKEIKIKRKDNQIILSDCRKGLVGYLISTNTVLGSLFFQPIDTLNKELVPTPNALIEEFIERVKDVLEQRKEMKEKRAPNK